MAEVVATETTGEPAAPAPPPPPTGDARLVHRGPIQRLLVRPEIGALLGTTAIWFFFWVVAPIFGTAAGTANYLDVAATLGIMAVAVSLLMIGGEFDLSSGAMTGATAMMVILLSKQLGTGGAGIPLSLAVPLSLAFALTIGWFNGTIVDKTGLPSFIVTLGSYFMLIGAKLSFSKMFVGQVTVAGLDKADGFEFWRKIFAASWIRNDHLWESRDTFWTALVIAAGRPRRRRRDRAQLPAGPGPRGLGADRAARRDRRSAWSGSSGSSTPTGWAPTPCSGS